MGWLVETTAPKYYIIKGMHAEWLPNCVGSYLVCVKFSGVAKLGLTGAHAPIPICALQVAHEFSTPQCVHTACALAPSVTWLHH